MLLRFNGSSQRKALLCIYLKKSIVNIKIQPILKVANEDFKSASAQCSIFLKCISLKRKNDMCLKLFQIEKRFNTDEEKDISDSTAAEDGTNCTEEPRKQSNEPNPTEKDIESTEISKNSKTSMNSPEADDSEQTKNHDSEIGKL